MVNTILQQPLPFKFRRVLTVKMKLQDIQPHWLLSAIEALPQSARARTSFDKDQSAEVAANERAKKAKEAQKKINDGIKKVSCIYCINDTLIK